MRLQLALNVRNLEEAVTYYAKLFGVQPHKERPGYADFAIDRPPLKLVLFENPQAPERLNHLGVEVFAPEEVEAAFQRLVTVGNPLGWMHRIAVNAIIDHYRRPRPNMALPEVLPSETADAMDVSRGELAACIRPLVMHLDPLSREALLAADLGGKSQVDAAREAGITVSTMKSRLQRGRQKLRQAMLRCCHVELDRRNGVIDVSQKKAADGGEGACCHAQPSFLPPHSPCSAAVRNRM